MDEWGWAGENILRWRSRLPTDPEFSNTEIVYELAYTLSRRPREAGRPDYLLDHDFAFPDREWPIRGLKVSLELDPDLEAAGRVLRLMDERRARRPGRASSCASRSNTPGAESPSAARGFATPARARGLLGILAAAIVFAYFSWRAAKRPSAASRR